MTSLRARIAVLLILAIVSVVGLASFAASRALQPPSPAMNIEPLARQFHLLAAIVERNSKDAIAAGVVLQQGPAAGEQDRPASRFLARALERTGQPRTAIVTRNGDAPSLTASIDLGKRGWLIVEMPDQRPPPGGWRILAVWIVLIVIGSTAVSLYAASRITRPLELLQGAVSRIGPDGLLAHIPETGSGEVRATAQALNRLSARLKSAIESRMRLVAAAGHDLRTPMTRMRLRAEFIPDEEERFKWFSDLAELDAIADSAIRLVKEEADGSREVLRLDTLVGDIVEELHGLGYGVEAPAPLALCVTAAPVALKRALRNLIINAATHGRGAKLELSRKGDRAEIRILDDGPGIPEELIGRVFEPFFRVDPARRKSIPGAGLGLAIAKEIIERFAGTLAIANRKPSGLVQTITLLLAGPGDKQ